jgi:Phosphoribosyl transferase domain
MKVASCCGYYVELSGERNKRRPRKPPFYEAWMFCLAVKSGEFHRGFYIERQSGKVDITENNFRRVRPIFGAWVAKAVAKFAKDNKCDVLVVPVPSKDGVKGADTYRSLKMAKDALKGTPYDGAVLDALRWKTKLKPAHEGGPRKRAELLPHLEVTENVKGRCIVLMDDLLTTGGSMLACQHCLEKAGAKVVGGVTCGRTVYDEKLPPYKAREVEFTEELHDFQ